MIRRFTFLLAFVASTVLTHAQVQAFEPVQYPTDFFRNPLAIPINLAANFGEIRTNHYHMGLDIRTNQRENLPVYAAGEGYVSRIKIEQYGFGRAIYITHPNGYTTVYAHLNNFYPELQAYLEQVQYQTESWEQDLYLQPNQFAVTKGQFIAYSGNTGGSAGPHLHFEIRETYTERNLNPRLFGFKIPDAIDPFFYRLYMYDRRYSTYAVPPQPISIKKAGSRYVTTAGEVITRWPVISFGIGAEDKANQGFRFGIYQAELRMDGKLVNAFRMNDFPYPDSRYINAGIDYSTKAKGGANIQHLSILPGNKISIFSPKAGNGVITLTDQEAHTVEIIIEDAEGNSSTLQFTLRYRPQPGNERMFTQDYQLMVPNQPNMVATAEVEAHFSARAFYDTVMFVAASTPSTDSRAVSALHRLHNHTVPVHDSFLVRIKPNAPLTPAQTGKLIMRLVSNRKKEGVKAHWNNGWAQAKLRDLGEVQLLVDEVPPTIVPSGWGNGSNVSTRSTLVLEAKDDLSELKSFRAAVDGQWLMFSRRRDQFIYKFDNYFPRGKHTLTIRAEDEAGNVTEKLYTLVR